MELAEAIQRADRFLGGERLKFAEANEIWKVLKAGDELYRARQVLARMRERSENLSDGIPGSARNKLCREHALLTSKDPELSAATRHDLAFKLLADGVDYVEDTSTPDKGGSVDRGEVLGIAGGICKRRWSDLGQLKDLLRAAELYERGAKCDMGDDAYPHINAAFVEDLLAEAGDQPETRRARADELRRTILEKLAPSATWFNAATRVEAWFGLKEYDKATEVLRQIDPATKCAPWELRTMVEQHAQLAHLHEDRPLDEPKIQEFFETLLPGAREAIRGMIIGKVGLALSGGGFRASFYHLGVLACLAERDILRDVEVLSCVSGGSIVGACYWLKLRQKFRTSPPRTRDDYVQLVRELIAQFKEAVETDPRRAIQPSRVSSVWSLARGARGVLDPEEMARALEKAFYRPLWDDDRSKDGLPIRMDELVFKPQDHDPKLTGSEQFNPGKHNWLRAHKVPALILNATTVNTGHAWHFTPTWMGESPWTIHEAADSIPRLEWSEYDTKDDVQAQWQMELSRAVAASACVPAVFEPMRLNRYYDDIDVSLVDGGVFDNQGTVALVGSDCHVILVSDACGQLMLEPKPPSGVAAAVLAAKRSMDTLIERVRLANFSDLDARRRSGLLRGLMFLHMKAGLNAGVIRLRDTTESYDVEVTPLSPAGVRRDFQQALAELRTDLDAFSSVESEALMACGYQMAGKALDDQLPALANVWNGAQRDDWPFKEMLGDIQSTDKRTGRRDALLTALRAGQNVTR
jgi:predicted acylesterase/phospholipase RssA